MNHDRSTHLMQLADRQLARLTNARGTTLRVARGSLWITQHQSSDDVVLAAGDVWTIEHNGLTLVEAQGCSAVQVSGCALELVPDTASHSGWWHFAAAAYERWAEGSLRRQHAIYF